MDGVPTVAVRLYITKNGNWDTNAGGTTSRTQGFWIESKTQTDIGFGFGWWLNGFYFSSELGGPGYKSKWQKFDGSMANFQMSGEMNSYAKCDILAESAWTGGSMALPSGIGYGFPKADWSRVYNKAMSKAFQTRIDTLHPILPLIDFYDNGSVSVSLKIYDGPGSFTDDAGSKGGYTGEAQFRSSSNRLNLSHADGTVQTIAKLDSFSDQVKKSFTFDVRNGDRLELDISSGSGLTFCYTKFYFPTVIPGWKLAD